MRRGWVLGFTLYVAFFALTIGLRWRQIGQPYTDFEWITAHSQVIIDNWLENGFWNELGISYWNPPSIEFSSLVSRHPYISYPCGAQLPLFVLAKALGWKVTPGFFHIWGLLWHGVIGLLLVCGLLLFSAEEKGPERSLYAFLPGFLWLGGRGPLTFFPTMWYADIVVLLPFVLVGLAEVIVARALLQERHRRWITWSLPVLIFWGMYTDWLFFPLGAVILVYRLLHCRNISSTFPAFVWQVVVPAALALTLFFLQLYWVLGPHFVSALRERFLLRSMDTTGAFNKNTSIMLWYIYGHFADNVGGLTLALTVLALVLLCIRPKTVPSPWKDFLCLVSVPSILLLLVFRQHTAVHSFTIVKFMIPIFIVLGGILPRAFHFPQKPCILALLCVFFLLHEGRQYWLSVDPPVDRQALEWEESVRRSFGYYAVLFTPEPSFVILEQPPGQLARSRKRIYEFDAERVAQLQRTLSEARIFLIGTAGAIDAHCPGKQTLSSSLYYCRL
jgi:hypothetical protein